MDDYEIIIVWNSNTKFIDLVEQKFKNSIVLKKQISLSIHERGVKINELYYPIPVPTNSTRCNYVEPLTIFVLKLPAKYEYYYRTEGYRLCNTEILNFKLETRKFFDYTIFHCSDNIDETKKAIKVFNLEKDLPKEVLSYDLINYDKLYHIRHMSDGSYKMVPLKDTVSVLYLIGYDNQTLIDRYSLLHRSDDEAIVQEQSIKYFNELPGFGQSHSEYHISAYKYKDKYILTDGKHRSALLYSRGDRHFLLKQSAPPCSDEIIEKSLVNPETNSHLENFNKFIYALNNDNIRFVIIRGHATMPKTADTDLDIVIHPEDYAKFLTLTKQYINSGNIAFNVEKKYNHPSQQLWYRAYRTLGTHDQFLTNKGYQLDTYNNVFFFLSQTDGTSLSKEFLNYLFDNRKKKFNFYIPNELSEMVLLFCRTWIDLGGNWKPKHKSRFDMLAEKNSKEEFKKLLQQA